MLGALRACFEHRWDEADRVITSDCALQLQPGYAPAHMFRAMARLCQGATSRRRRQDFAARPNWTRSQPATAREWLICITSRETIHRPRSFSASLSNWIATILKRDCTKDSCTSGSSATRRSYRASHLPISRWISAWFAAAHAQEGSLKRAGECVERLHQLASLQYVTPLAEGFAAVGMGDPDLALQCLEAAITHKTNFVNLLAIEPFFHPLHADRRFDRLLKKLNLSHPRRP